MPSEQRAVEEWEEEGFCGVRTSVGRETQDFKTQDTRLEEEEAREEKSEAVLRPMPSKMAGIGAMRGDWSFSRSVPSLGLRRRLPIGGMDISVHLPMGGELTDLKLITFAWLCRGGQECPHSLWAS